MILVKPGINFAINYPSYGLVTGLFIQATVYDVSTGTPNVVAHLTLAEIQNGFYSASYPGVSTKTYLVITLVYTDNTYSTIDTNYAPNADCYKVTDAPVAFGAMNYGIYSQESDLFIAASIFNCTTGSLSFVSKLLMTHILGGVYFVSFTGLQDNSYQVLKFVYTDGTLATVDTNWNAGSDIFELIQGGGSSGGSSVLFEGAQLNGQDNSANIVGQTLSAVLKEAI